MVHNGVHLSHTEAIQRIMIRLVDLEQLYVVPAKYFIDIEMDGSDEEEIPQEKVSNKDSGRHSEKRRQLSK